MGSVYNPQYIKMGNICSVIAKEKKKATPPHTLNELLSSVQIEDDPTFHDLQLELTRNVWLSRFYEFLNKRDLEEEETALKFLIFTQPLQNQFSKRKTFGKSDQDRRRLFSTVCHYFLSENVCISLDNEALFNDLMATLNSIKAGLKVSDESLLELLKARKDPLVWDEGLEPMYIKFVQQTNMSQVACLLSLL